MISHHGIKVDQFMISAIFNMLGLRNLHELKILLGKLAYVRTFISNLLTHFYPFRKLMKKETLFERDDACQNDFDSIKMFLFNPYVHGALIPKKPLFIYFRTQEHSLGLYLAQGNNIGMENDLYYLS